MENNSFIKLFLEFREGYKKRVVKQSTQVNKNSISINVAEGYIKDKLGNEYLLEDTEIVTISSIPKYNFIKICGSYKDFINSCQETLKEKDKIKLKSIFFEDCIECEFIRLSENDEEIYINYNNNYYKLHLKKDGITDINNIQISDKSRKCFFIREFVDTNKNIKDEEFKQINMDFDKKERIINFNIFMDFIKENFKKGCKILAGVKSICAFKGEDIFIEGIINQLNNQLIKINNVGFKFNKDFPFYLKNLDTKKEFYFDWTNDYLKNKIIKEKKALV